MLLTNVVITNFTGPFIMKAVGPAWSFIFWGTCGLVGLFYLVCFTKDTTYKTIEIENAESPGKTLKLKKLLSQEEKYELYMPNEYKDK